MYRLFLALLVGFFVALWIVQNNPLVEQKISSSVLSALNKAWGASIHVKRVRLNLFTCTLFLEQGIIVDNDKQTTQWSFDRARIYISPFAYWYKKKAHLYITIDNVTASTGVCSDGIDVVGHVKKIIRPPIEKQPISLRSIMLRNFDVTALVGSTPVRVLLHGFLEFKKTDPLGDYVKKSSRVGTLAITNMDVFVGQRICIKQARGLCHFKKNVLTHRWGFTCEHEIPFCILDPVKSFIVKGQWDDALKEVQLKESGSDAPLLTCSVLKDAYLSLKGSLAASRLVALYSFLTESTYCSTINVNECYSIIDVRYPLQPVGGGVSGLLGLRKVSFAGTFFDAFDCTITSCEQGIVRAALSGSRDGKMIASGALVWDFMQHQGSLVAKNAAPISSKEAHSGTSNAMVSGVVIKPEQCKIALHVSKDGGVHGNYALAVAHVYKGIALSTQGSFEQRNKEFLIQGKTGAGTYHATLALDPHLHIRSIDYCEQDQRVIDLAVDEQDDYTLRGNIYFSCFRSFLDQSMSRLMLGGDKVCMHVTLDQKDLMHMRGSCVLHGGKIYIPDTRNLIEGCSTAFEYDYAQRLFMLNNFMLTFCKGSIDSQRVTLRFDDAWNLSMVHAPFSINNLFINWKRDFFGVFYGNFLFNKLPDNDMHVTGLAVVKKALLKDNIFSQGASIGFSGAVGRVLPIKENIKVDVRIISEQPIKARTDTLETYASLDLRVRYAQGNNVMQLPSIAGTVSLDRGQLKFLRNTLTIEYGKIHFIENQFNDPMIDLIASNRINKYIVTLQATGSLEKPTIMLESNPALTEEQVVGLLLSGSENARLQTDLFAMLEQNLHNIVLGSKDKLPKATTFLQTLTRPFKYVQITPDFTDQSGRGGIKGTLSVNVSDQVYAQIQKNFNLQEDFSAQVEYFLADDVSLKAVKDQRGELGAEVEVRLKF